MGMVAVVTLRGSRRMALTLVGVLAFALHSGVALAAAPSAPTAVVASPASSQALVSWTAPSSNGGSAITGYTITPYTSSGAQTALPVTGTGTSAIVSGLANGTAYAFTVKATNGDGTSAESAQSSSITPWDTIYDFGTTPAIIDSGDGTPVELGVKFTPTQNGAITGIRFYKAAANTGTHVGSLWTASGQLLESATFSNETASGWQTVSFPSSIAVTAGTTYVAGYYAPNGHYSATVGGLTNVFSNPPLTAPASANSGGNGVFLYAGSSTFPNQSFNNNSYSVDVLFAPPSAASPPAAPTNVSATGGDTNAKVSWSAPADHGSPITSYTITPFIGLTAQTPTVVSGAPPPTGATVSGLTNGTSYTFTVQASNGAGTSTASAPSGSVTPATGTAPTAPLGVAASPASGQALVSWSPPASDGGSAITGYTVTPYLGSTAQTATTVSGSPAPTSANVTGLSNGKAYTFTVKATNGEGTGPESAQSASLTPWDTIFDFGLAPQAADSGDGSSVEVGTRFTADQSGAITGIRFYKSVANTGTHIGSLWTASGQLLESATFTGETASGWQTVTFPSSVPVTAGTTYVAAYFDPNGHYATTPGGLTNSIDNSPLHALAGGASSTNGVYSYTSSSTFPNNSYNDTNYWVDVLFAPPSAASAPATPTNVSATAGDKTASITWNAPADNGSPITSYTITPFAGSTAQTPTVTGNAQTTATVSGLTDGTAYTFTVKATNSVGTGSASAPSSAVTPFAITAPSAPTNVTANPASSEALVTWTAPASGAPISSYTITPYIGSTAQTPFQVSNGSATSATVTGLTNESAYTFTVTAVNGGGAGTPSSASVAVTPEDTIFDFSGTPQNVDSGDTGSLELGVKFTADTNGFVTGVRFYKSAANTGTHLGNLWSASGQLLASAKFTNESASGWQTVSFSTPVAVSAGTTYVASYFDPSGHYSVTSGGLSNAVDNPPLHALSSAASGGNGLFAYSSTTTFPGNSYNASNYWVDVMFTTASSVPAPGQPTNVTATALPQAASVSWSAPTSGGPVGTYTVTPYVGSTAQPTTTVSSPATTATVTGLIPGTTYTFTVQAGSPAGTGTASAASNAVTPTPASAPSAPTSVTASPATGQALVSWTTPTSNGGSPISGYTVTPYIGTTAQQTVAVSNPSATSALVPGLTDGTAYTFTVKASNTAGTSSESAPSGAVTPQNTIFDFSGTPAALDGGDSGSVNLGVQFTADTTGTVNGIRFYKASANTGTHIGSLWTTSGQLLESATFTNETASGWQTVTFASPVAITAGTTYVASYFAPNGNYSASSFGLNAAVDNSPLHALSNAVSGGNGLFAYGAGTTFPNQSYQANNYWVDVLFSPSSSNSTPGQPSNVSASPGFDHASVTWTAPWNGGSQITSYTVTPYIGTTAQTPTTVSGTPAPNSATVNGLTNGTAYTFKVTATNTNGTGAASSASNSVTPGPQPAGQWSALMNWPLVAVHSVLMDTGNVLTWDAWQQPQPTQEYDPSTQAFTNPISSPDGIFCSAMAQLPDGRILVVGGYGELSTGNLGIVDTSIYNPATSTWTRVADMHYPRWYPGLTELSDGRYVVISGKSTDFGTWADTPEVYDPTSNTWTLLSNVSTSQIHELEYPSTYQLPNGNVFVLGPEEDLSYELNVANQTWTQVGGKSGVINGGSVMYRPGKILYAGGAASFSTESPAQSNAATIDLTAATPQWQATQSLAYPRAFNTLQMLADGTVLAVGGEAETALPGGQGEVSGGVLPSEIWDPNTGQWTTVASMAVTRGYHTSTLLLPDGRVLVAGSGHAAPGDPGQYNAQIYSPPYLFKGTRPTIASAPASATYGSNITVSTPDAASIQSVNLVDLGASTHQNDFDQHFVPLSFTAGSGSLTVTMPASGAWAPPANYMLFIVNSNGVPSVASIINVGAGSGDSPAAAQAVTATAVSASTAHVSWTAASASGAPVTSYTVTPSLARTALAPTTVSGNPAPTSATITGLSPGHSYTFKVKATNGHGTSPPSAKSNAVSPAAAVRPTFVQRTSGYADTSTGLGMRLGAVTHGDRLVVQTSAWGDGASAGTVTDSSGDHFTELFSGRAADGTEMSVWTAPVTARTGARPTITVSPTWKADVGAVVLEYAGLSSAPGVESVDQIIGRGGVTRARGTVSSGAAGATSAGNELAVGLYADSGFGDTVRAGVGYKTRFGLSRTRTMMEQLVEDRVVGAGQRPAATVHTGAKTPWLMATIVFRGAGSATSAASTPAASHPRASGQQAARLRQLLKQFTAAHAEAAKHPVPPLSMRPRTHALAGAISTYTGLLGDFTPLYYCLVSVADQ
jgi:hypothetical protein